MCPDGQKWGFQQAGGGCRSLPCSRLLFLFSWCSSGAVGQSGQRLHLHLERMLLACYAEGAALRKPFPGVVLCGKHLAGLPGGRGEKCCFPSWGRQQGCPLCLCLCLCPAGWLQKAPAWLCAWGWGLPAGKQLKPRAFGQAGRGVRGGENLSALQSKPISCRAEGKGQGEGLSVGRADLQPLTLGLPASSPGQASRHRGRDSLDACPPAQGGAPGACLGAAPLAPAPLPDCPRHLQGDQGEVWRRAWHGRGVCASGTRAQGSVACREEPGSSP